MATTTGAPYNIAYPQSGDNVAPLETVFATTATSVHNAMAGMATGNGSFRGTMANRPTAGSAGRYYYATDTGLTWFDTGAAWVSGEPGSYVAWPTSVANGTVGAGGNVSFTNVATVRLDGVFSSRFQFYDIFFDVTIASSQNINMNMSQSGTIINSAASYQYGRLWTSGTNTVTALAGTSSTALSLAGIAATRHMGQIRMASPADAAVITILTGQVNAGNQVNTLSGSRAAATAEDGFQLSSAANITGTIKVVGIV